MGQRPISLAAPIGRRASLPYFLREERRERHSDVGYAGYCTKTDWINDTYYNLYFRYFLREGNLSFVKDYDNCKALKNVEKEDRFEIVIWCQDTFQLCNLTMYKNVSIKEGRCDHEVTQEELNAFLE